MRVRNLRMNETLNLLKETQTCTVRDLAVHFNVSEITIRRDLTALQKNGDITWNYGKVSLNKNSNIDKYELTSEKGVMTLEKELIGQYAATLVNANDLIIIDTGSTTEYFAKNLPDDIEFTALCYTYNILEQLVRKPHANIIFSGGYYHANGQFFESTQGTNLIESIRVNKLFLSASGVHNELGVTCGNNYEVLTKRAAISSAQTRILLADSSKFSRLRLAYFSQLNEIDVVVTDRGLSAEWEALLREHNIELHIV